MIDFAIHYADMVARFIGWLVMIAGASISIYFLGDSARRFVVDRFRYGRAAGFWMVGFAQVAIGVYDLRVNCENFELDKARGYLPIRFFRYAALIAPPKRVRQWVINRRTAA